MELSTSWVNPSLPHLIIKLVNNMEPWIEILLILSFLIAMICFVTIYDKICKEKNNKLLLPEICSEQITTELNEEV